MGDLNVDFSDQQDKNYVHMKHVCLSMNLRNLISSPTRTTATTAKILDRCCFDEHRTVFDHRGYNRTGAWTSLIMLRPETATLGRPDNLESSVVVRSWPNGGQGNATTQLEEALARHMSTLTSSGINPMWNEWKQNLLRRWTKWLHNVLFGRKKGIGAVLG